MKVAVIGGGVMVLATGWALKRRGHEPVVYEQFQVGHPHGSSHGRSRIFRLAYPEDEYVRLAQESLGLLRELEGETGENTRAHPDDVEADAVVVTAGSWVNELLDEPLDVKVTRETLCYFRADAGGRPGASVGSFKPHRPTHDMYS